jgi:AraC-like DNA-binding protein
LWFACSQDWITTALDAWAPESIVSPPFSRPPLAFIGAMHRFFARARKEGDLMHVEEMACALLRGLAAAPSSEQTVGPNAGALVRAADALLAEKFNQRLRLSDVAVELGVSFSYLARTYRAVTGSRLHTQLTRLRSCEAMRHLADGVENLTELALDLGYSSHSHFTADFRRSTGLTPSGYRLASQS